MKRASLLVATAASLALATTAALAQSGGGHSGGGHSGGGHSGGSGGHGSGGHGGGHYYGGGHYHGGGRYYGGYYGYGPRYYYPYWGFGWPYYASPYYYPYAYPAYPYPAYAPPPAYGTYAMPPAPQPPVYTYQERSQAQVVPPEPRRDTPPPAPAPRIERMTLSAKELFAFDEAKLHAPQPRLDEIAEAMKANPQIDKVRITGYTDRIGTESYNLKLSQRRADAVKDYLVAFKGIDPKRLVAVGKGEADAVVQCEEKERPELIKCLEPNRRVEVEEITVERRVP